MNACIIQLIRLENIQSTVYDQSTQINILAKGQFVFKEL